MTGCLQRLRSSCRNTSQFFARFLFLSTAETHTLIVAVVSAALQCSLSYNIQFAGHWTQCLMLPINGVRNLITYSHVRLMTQGTHSTVLQHCGSALLVLASWCRAGGSCCSRAPVCQGDGAQRGGFLTFQDPVFQRLSVSQSANQTDH